jgi:hypothetical protein
MRTEDNNQAAERWLDDALKQYGEAEPRPGLENRVLANLLTEQARLTLYPWYWRPAVAAVMIAVFSIGAFLLNRGSDVTRATISNRPSIALGNSETEHPVASAVRPHVALRQPARSRPGGHIAHSSSGPRLEQFPAPAPLSEQEEMLARYVRERRQEATMVARARAELLKHELKPFVEQSPSEQPRDLEQ